MQQWRKYLVELIGTFFLTFVVALSGNPIAIGAILAAMVYMGGYISGGHYNPAVTLAAMLTGKRLDWKTGLSYMFFQILGATLAASTFFIMAQTTFMPEAGQGLGAGVVAASEVLFTMILALVVLHVTTSDTIKENHFYGLAIGLTIMAGGFSVSPISGAVFNPAIGLGTLLVDIADIAKNSSQLTSFLSYYLLAPLVGGALAALLFRLTAPSFAKKQT